MKHTFLTLTTLLLASVSASNAADMLPLAGEWRFALDARNEGVAQEWFKTTLTDTVRLPGTLAQNQKGPQDDHNHQRLHCRARQRDGFTRAADGGRCAAMG
jgi:hypothetical protein